MLRSLAAALACTLFALASPHAASAQSYPTKPITIVVPFAAGGPLDTLARALSEPLTRDLGQSVVIENMAGAGGSTGVGHVVKAAPDGYVVCIGNWSTHVINAAIYSLNYDLVTDLKPIALLTSNPQLIVARKSLPVDNLKDLVTWLRTNPANLGTAGVGSASHVSGLFLQQQTGAKIAFVHHRGGGPALQDVIGGHLDMMFDQVSTSLPYVQGGTVKAFAVTSKSRLAAAPDVPTVDEAGLPGFYISVWNGIWGPKDMPQETALRLQTAFSKALDDPALAKRLVSLGQEIPPAAQRTPAALLELQRAELAKWVPIVKAAAKPN